MQQKNLRALIALLTLSAVSGFTSFPAQVAQGVVPKEEPKEMKPLEKTMTAVAKEGPRSGMVYAIKSGVVNLLKIVDVALLVGALFLLPVWMIKHENRELISIFLDKIPRRGQTTPNFFFVALVFVLTFFLTAVLSQLFFYLAKDFSMVKKHKRGWLISIKGALFTLCSLSLPFLVSLLDTDIKKGLAIPKNFCAVFAWNLLGYLVATFFDLLLSACYEVADLSFDLYA